MPSIIIKWIWQFEDLDLLVLIVFGLVLQINLISLIKMAELIREYIVDSRFVKCNLDGFVVRH